jgi:hypothetical protein
MRWWGKSMSGGVFSRLDGMREERLVGKTCIHEFILRGYEAFGRYLRFKICEILYV